jgi:hypothetical protein
VVATEKPNRRLKCKICLAQWRTLEIIDREDWLPCVLRSMLVSGELESFLEKRPGALDAVMRLLSI